MPIRDGAGLHILDPNDRLGRKSEYITILHKKLLQQHVPKGNGKLAIDIGCGFGRLTPSLLDSGWNAIGIDPSQALVDFAIKYNPGPHYLVGRLPQLPFPKKSASFILLQNVLRALKMMGNLEAVQGIGDYLEDGGFIYVIENLRRDHSEYLAESLILKLMEREGATLVRRLPARSGRWWMLYLIRYGLIPRNWLSHIADWELAHMSRKSTPPRWNYWNVLYIFQKSKPRYLFAENHVII